MMRFPNLPFLKSHIGLVIHPQAIEVVTVKPTLWGARLGQFARVLLPVEAGSSTESEDQAISQAIHEALAICQARGREVAVSIPGRDVLLRSFTLPLLPRQEWEQAVQFEVRRYIPFKVDELTWNYHAIEHRPTKQLAVVFVGIRNEVFARIQHWLAEAGVMPTTIEALSVSLARVVGMAPPFVNKGRGRGPKASRDSFVGIVDLEQDAAHITIMKDQVPYLSRDVSLGARSERPLERPEGQARLDGIAELLLSELRVSFGFFTHEHLGASISKVLLFGDESLIAPWCSWLSEQLRCPVELGALPVEVPVGQPAASLLFAAAVGLAMKGLRGAKVKLDFLARSRRVSAGQKSPKPIVPFLWSIRRHIAVQVGLATACLLALSWISNRGIMAVRSQLERTIQSSPRVGWGLEHKTLPELQELQQQVDTRLAVLRSTIQQRVSVAEKLDALAKALPDGMWLDGISYQDRLDTAGANQISLTLRGSCFLPGRSDELEVISEFAHRIKQDQSFFQGFTTAQLGEVTQAADHARAYSYRTFRLNCSSERRLF